MNRRILFIALGILALIIAGAGWYFASPLFIDNTVNEEFPFSQTNEAEFGEQAIEVQTAAKSSSSAVVSDSEEENSQSSTDQQDRVADETDLAEETMADQPMESTDPDTADEFSIAVEGQFTGTDNLHQGSGKAIVYQNDDQRVLRFEEFSVTNGPDLHVILSKHPAPISRSDVGEDYIDLGSLKGNIGNQNYDIPADIDLSEYKSVVIYCVPFHVVFATATLSN
jgi:hypothetical protein